MQLMVFSQDGRDLRESKDLALMPILGEGTIRLASEADWEDLEATVGEIRNARWQTLETLKPQWHGGLLTLPIDADRATAIVLVGEASDREERIRRFVETVRPDWRGV